MILNILPYLGFNTRYRVTMGMGGDGRMIGGVGGAVCSGTMFARPVVILFPKFGSAGARRQNLSLLSVIV